LPIVYRPDAGEWDLLNWRMLPLLRSLALLAVGLIAVGASAAGQQKSGMPDLCQEGQTCLPTATADLIVWFGHHGYPKLLLKGTTEEERDLHSLHGIMADTDARYDLGTRTDAITYGIGKYIREAGYDCDVEYRGLDWGQARFSAPVRDPLGDKYRAEYKTPAAFSSDWLQDNRDPNHGFILLLAYVRYDREANRWSDAISAGHAVTLVSATPDTILVHDPAHYEDEPGRKILTPTELTSGSFRLPGYEAPVAGLLLLEGSLLGRPAGASVLLTGAVCITMHPQAGPGSDIIASAAGSPTTTLAGSLGAATGNGPVVAPAGRPVGSQAGWGAWLFSFLFGK
jgi:hypothetical protein